MSGLVGKGIRSYKKANVSDSNNPALGFRNFIMAFEVSAVVGAGVAIELANDAMPLTPPAEMVTAGFQAPSNIEIINAQLGTFRNNVTVTSNLNGILIDRVSYTLTDTTITFDDGLNAGEIIVIKRGNEVINGNRIVDARPLRASGTVDFSTIGSAPVIFQVGEGFRIAPSTTSTGGIDNRQIGFVQVFADGVLQARNVGNEDESMLPATEQTGNYREVIVDGLGNLLSVQNGVTANAIEFNQFQPFSAEEGVIVISTNLIVDSPNNTGVIDQLSTLQSQITQNDTELARIPTPVGGTPADIIQVNAGGTAYELVTPSSGGGGGLIQINEFTATPGTTTLSIPADTAVIEIEGGGGGGGGAGGTTVGSYNSTNASGNSAGSGGGGAAGYGRFYLNVATGDISAISIGTVGAGGAAGGGSTGGNTSFAYNGTTYTFFAGGGGGSGATNGPSNSTTAFATHALGGRGGSGGGTMNVPNNRGITGQPARSGGSFVDASISGNSYFSDGDGSLSVFFVMGNIRCAPGAPGGNNPIANGGRGIIGEGSFAGHATGGGGGGGAGFVNGAAAFESGDLRRGGDGGRGGLIFRFYSGTTLNTI